MKLSQVTQRAPRSSALIVCISDTLVKCCSGALTLLLLVCQYTLCQSHIMAMQEYFGLCFYWFLDKQWHVMDQYASLTVYVPISIFHQYQFANFPVHPIMAMLLNS